MTVAETAIHRVVVGQACDSKASTLLVRPTGWPEPNTALSDSGKENSGYGEEEPYRESYLLDVSRNTSSAQAHVTDEMGTQSSFHMETFRPPSSINSNVSATILLNTNNNVDDC